MAESHPALLWFRNDLRLADHPALVAACARGPVIPVFIWAPEEEGSWAPGTASRWWLHHSLDSLDRDLRSRGSRLIFRTGPTLAALERLIAESHSSAVYWSRRHEPAVVARDAIIGHRLRKKGIEIRTFPANLLFEPEEVTSRSGKPFQVFSPFYRACLAREGSWKTVPRPKAIATPAKLPSSEALEALGLLPSVERAAGIRAEWTPGEEAAVRRLRRFLSGSVLRYPSDRDRPDLDGVSRLSPHLHFGEITTRQIVIAAHRAAEADRTTGSLQGVEAYLRQIYWREFAHHLLHHFPNTTDTPLRPEFGRFPWRRNPEGLRRWQRGRTGFPIVDAGMRQLWETGWMHNRARMITASFLVKDLLIPWIEGARWFWDTLVDADLANNTLGWQWTAGCGADAAPFFRIFNPVRQGLQFDPEGNYVRRWVPELARVPAAWIHRPWEAPSGVLVSAGVKVGGRVGDTYPAPIIDHAAARERALAAWRMHR